LTLRIGLNGAGRVGRTLLRMVVGQSDLELVGVNDIAAPEAIAHLLRHDSVHGRLDTAIAVQGDCLLVGERRVPYTRHQDPERIPWGACGADVVVEATGHFTARAAAARHLVAGAGRVLVSAVSPGADASVVLGLHDGVLPAPAKVVSSASCTTHAAALPLALLSRWYGVVAADMTTVHCTTGSQVTIDQPHADPRRARSALLSMIPTSTTATAGLVEVLPELRGRLSCLAVRVPTAAVSMVELVVHTERPVDAPGVLVARLEEHAAREWPRYLGVCREPLVSIDFKGDGRSSIVDAELCERPGERLVRLIAWYDNEWGYTSRIVDLLRRWA
jgi:glyceraldehyde 3-phosphate dehydrogenase